MGWHWDFILKLTILGYLVFFNFDFSLKFIDDFINIFQIRLAPTTCCCSARIKTQGILNQFHFTWNIIQGFSLGLEQILLGAFVVQSVLRRTSRGIAINKTGTLSTHRTPWSSVEVSVVRDHTGHPHTALHIRMLEDVPTPQSPTTQTLSLISITNHRAIKPHLRTLAGLAIVQELAFVLATLQQNSKSLSIPQHFQRVPFLYLVNVDHMLMCQVMFPMITTSLNWTLKH